MKRTIALIGDYDSSVPAHQAIPVAIQAAAQVLRQKSGEIDVEWVPTDGISSASQLDRFTGIWCVPASPYRSMEGALLAIRVAREMGIPFLGTCGGFQHAIIEYARNVLNWPDAEHAETAPGATRAIISLLECGLVEVSGSVRLLPRSRLAAAYGVEKITAGYRCRYGLNRQFQEALLAGPLRVAAVDDAGEVRGVELDGHPFFVATLFQPERAALRGEPVPVVEAFLAASAR